MKKLALSLLLFVSAGYLYAQHTATANTVDLSSKKGKHHRKKIELDRVPKEVRESFISFYPEVGVVDWYAYPYYWDIETDEALYDTAYYVEYMYPEFFEVEFSLEAKKHKGLFARSGKHIHTTSEIRPEELPVPVANAINASEYKDWTVKKEKEKVEKKEPKETLYKVTVSKGKEKRILYYNPDGKLRQVRKIIL